MKGKGVGVSKPRKSPEAEVFKLRFNEVFDDIGPKRQRLFLKSFLESEDILGMNYDVNKSVDENLNYYFKYHNVDLDGALIHFYASIQDLVKNGITYSRFKIGDDGLQHRDEILPYRDKLNEIIRRDRTENRRKKDAEFQERVATTSMMAKTPPLRNIPINPTLEEDNEFDDAIAGPSKTGEGRKRRGRKKANKYYLE
jgi:hypothetical protein